LFWRNLLPRSSGQRVFRMLQNVSDLYHAFKKTSYPVILKTVKLRSFYWLRTVFVFQVHNYVGEWLQYQSLWDLQADNLYGKLGEDINLWMKCLNDIK